MTMDQGLTTAMLVVIDVKMLTGQKQPADEAERQERRQQPPERLAAHRQGL